MEDIRTRAALAGVSLKEAVDRALRNGLDAITDNGEMSSDIQLSVHRQSMAVGESAHEREDQSFIDAITTVPRGRIGQRIGYLGATGMARLGRLIRGFLSLNQ